MNAPKFATLGCRLNAYETEAMKELSQQAGLENAVVVNTCAVTAEAVRKARQEIRKLRRENPDARLIVTGCAAQTEPETFAGMDEVDAVIGNEAKGQAATYRKLPDFGVSESEKIRVNDIMSVREIRSWSPTTELPGQPHGAKGVLDIRGSVVQVYDLAVLLGGYGSEVNTGQVVLVVSLDYQDVGLLVDTVSDIIFAQPEDLRPVPASGGDRSNAMVSGMFKNEDRLIAILNLNAMFPS